MARCGCGGADCGCSLQAGDNVTVSGSGSSANPWIVNAITDCTEVRTCHVAGSGTTYDPTDGSFDVCISPNANNGLTQDVNGCLYVQMGASTVTAGCGLTGTGAPADPIRAATGAWPYACDILTRASNIFCDSAGQLRGEPRGQVSFHSFGETRNYANLAVPGGFDQPGDSFQTTITNPDPCRPAFILVEREADVDFNLPPNSGAAYGHSTDEMFFFANTGSVNANDIHTQTTKVFALGATVAPGANQIVSFDVTLGRGFGGATYNRIQVFIRAMILSL
jgi:hypothetical protein